MKTDSSIKRIVSTTIRRKGIDMHSWIWTRLWDNGDPWVMRMLSDTCEFAEGELPILYSYVDDDNWTLFTSRAVWYSNNGRCSSVLVTSIVTYELGLFKGDPKRPIERLVLREDSDREHLCPYRTGKSSMGPVYAIQTLHQITRRA